MRPLLTVVLAMAAVAPAAAEVASSNDAGFAIAHRAATKAPPARIYALLGKPSLWWNPAHSYSGDARNLSLALRAGGCFCEKLPGNGGSVEHGRVVLAWPAKLLRIQGSLGPLQAEGATGSLSWTLSPKDGGTEIRLDYVVGGYLRAGGRTLAPLVDKVVGEQLARLTALADKR